jgi:hypothetical protein
MKVAFFLLQYFKGSTCLLLQTKLYLRTLYYKYLIYLPALYYKLLLFLPPLYYKAKANDTKKGI